MAGANSNIQLTDLDFDTIKNNLKTFLQSQDAFKDYNFEGSGLSVLLDILSYNTQYNAYYLNMAANEMFLDSAVQRNSVISHAKLLNYTPKSAIAPSATVNLTFDGASGSQIVIPAYTNFISEAVDGVNYNFVTIENYQSPITSNTSTFTNVELKQGVASNYNYTVDSVSNPTFTFEIPDSTIDTTTLKVVVQESISNSSIEYYSLGTNIVDLNGTSKVYFLQESFGNTYQIYFGDGIIGKKLVDGNIVRVSYLTTEGTSAAGANNFVLLDNVGSYSTVTIDGVAPATNGSDKETIESIKYQAPKAYSSRGRAVTKEDYITALQQNTLGVSFDSVNVWGGESNVPPVYGQVFISLKPTGGYSLTETQKQRLIQDVIKPISIVTVDPIIVEPDYTYISVTCNVVYDQKRTLNSANQISNLVKTAIQNYAVDNLNTFDSTLSYSDMITGVESVDPSIVSSELVFKVQKKFYPNLVSPQTYNLYYGTEIEKSSFLSGVNSAPGLSYINPQNRSEIIKNVYIEEIASSTSGLESISILNPGFGYQYVPTVTIKGDGTGAEATAVLSATGTIKRIDVTNTGAGYTSAIVVITPATGDTTGQMCAAVAKLQGQYGTLRSYYYSSDNVKTIFDSDIGTVDYINGVVTLNNFNPLEVNNDFGQLTISAKPKSSIISSSFNRIVTIDPYDPNAITINVTAKN